MHHGRVLVLTMEQLSIDNRMVAAILGLGRSIASGRVVSRMSPKLRPQHSDPVDPR